LQFFATLQLGMPVGSSDVDVDELRGRAVVRPRSSQERAMTDKTQHLPHQISGKDGNPGRDAPWIFRTYAGHSSPKASNALYRTNLSKGQTGLSIAFDLATQCGYDSDDRIARPEVGKVGVPFNSLDDFRVLGSRYLHFSA
jgi:methylmalonyl-CoA mutase N-terminal domain/subunit